MQNQYFKTQKISSSAIVFNIPHSSTKIPDEFQKDFLLPPEIIENEKNKQADLFTKELYQELFKKHNFIYSNISRIVTDIERFEDENLESMSKVGMSALYTKSTKGKILRKLSPKRKELLLSKIYRPYHNNFNKLVSDSLKNHGRCLIIDCHSFPSIPRDYEPNQELNRPDFCLGFEEFHAPKDLVKKVKNFLIEKDFSIRLNKPFAGSIVPSAFYRKNPNVKSLMIEINRNLYMNENLFTKNTGFQKIQDLLSQVSNFLD